MLVSCCSGAHASGLAGGQSLTLPGPCTSISFWHHKVGCCQEWHALLHAVHSQAAVACGVSALAIWAVLLLQAHSAAGRKVLWDLKAPELLKTG